MKSDSKKEDDKDDVVTAEVVDNKAKSEKSEN
jgi:sec-independent protein translocase protein tatA/E homolog